MKKTVQQPQRRDESGCSTTIIWPSLKNIIKRRTSSGFFRDRPRARKRLVLSKTSEANASGASEWLSGRPISIGNGNTSKSEWNELTITILDPSLCQLKRTVYCATGKLFRQESRGRDGNGDVRLADSYHALRPSVRPAEPVMLELEDCRTADAALIS